MQLHFYVHYLSMLRINAFPTRLSQRLFMVDTCIRLCMQNGYIVGNWNLIKLLLSNKEIERYRVLALSQEIACLYHLIETLQRDLCLFAIRGKKSPTRRYFLFLEE